MKLPCTHPRLFLLLYYANFSPNSSKQLDLYDETFRPTVDAVLEGYNGTARFGDVDYDCQIWL